ncbi:MAG: SdpI family protein [Eubacteriales bacterium]|nr:SdpI family protein [Eubacteriales bacterium]
MGFWVFMLLMELILPVSLLGLGRYFRNGAPRKINYVFGYRTTMSMKNEQTWQFAHRYCGRIWYACGKVMLPLTVVVMLLVYGAGERRIGAVGGAWMAVQLIPFVGAIAPTEIALRRHFDRDGTPR